MQPLVHFLLERWSPAPPSAAAQETAESGAADSPDSAALEAPPRLDICRLCDKRIQASDTVAASADDVVHTACYDRSIEDQPKSTNRPLA